MRHDRVDVRLHEEGVRQVLRLPLDAELLAGHPVPRLLRFDGRVPGEVHEVDQSLEGLWAHRVEPIVIAPVVEMRHCVDDDDVVGHVGHPPTRRSGVSIVGSGYRSGCWDVASDPRAQRHEGNPGRSPRPARALATGRRWGGTPWPPMKTYLTANEGGHGDRPSGLRFYDWLGAPQQCSVGSGWARRWRSGGSADAPFSVIVRATAATSCRDHRESGCGGNGTCLVMAPACARPVFRWGQWCGPGRQAGPRAAPTSATRFEQEAAALMEGSAVGAGTLRPRSHRSARRLPVPRAVEPDAVAAGPQPQPATAWPRADSRSGAKHAMRTAGDQTVLRGKRASRRQ